VYLRIFFFQGDWETAFPGVFTNLPNAADWLTGSVGFFFFKGVLKKGLFSSDWFTGFVGFFFF